MVSITPWYDNIHLVFSECFVKDITFLVCCKIRRRDMLYWSDTTFYTLQLKQLHIVTSLLPLKIVKIQRFQLFVSNNTTCL